LLTAGEAEEAGRNARPLSAMCLTRFRWNPTLSSNSPRAARAARRL